LKVTLFEGNKYYVEGCIVELPALKLVISRLSPVSASWAAKPQLLEVRDRFIRAMSRLDPCVDAVNKETKFDHILRAYESDKNQ